MMKPIKVEDENGLLLARKNNEKSVEGFSPNPLKGRLVIFVGARTRRHGLDQCMHKDGRHLYMCLPPLNLLLRLSIKDNCAVLLVGSKR